MRESRQPERTGVADHESQGMYSVGNRYQATPSETTENLVRDVAIGKGKVNPVHAVEALRFARGWGSHIFQTFGSQMTVRSSAL
jgi:hypothetical protein